MSLQVAPGTTSLSILLYIVDDDGDPVATGNSGDFPKAGNISYALETAGGVTIGDIEVGDLASAGDAFTADATYPLSDGFWRFDVRNALLTTTGKLRFFGDSLDFHVLCEPILIGNPAVVSAGPITTSGGAVSNVTTTATATSVTNGVTLAANQDVRNVSGTISDKTGYALTSGERESIGTAVWATTTRTLSSFGTLVADVATAVWGAVTRTITGGTVTTVSDKTGYSLATAPPTAGEIKTAIEAEGSKLALIDAALTAIKGGGWSTETLKAIKDAIDDIEVGGGGGDATEAKQDAILAAIGVVDGKIDSVGGVPGPGATAVTLTIQQGDGTPVADADVWISTDAGGTNVVAGTLQTNSLGQVTFLLDTSVTYYRWVQKDGVTFTNPQAFTPE